MFTPVREARRLWERTAPQLTLELDELPEVTNGGPDLPCAGLPSGSTIGVGDDQAPAIPGTADRWATEPEPCASEGCPDSVLIARFWARVAKTTTCWLWVGSRSNGYGQFWDGSKHLRPHRFAYEFLVGPIAEGLVLDHLCRVRHCVNPAHLDPVTQRENILRGAGACARNAAKTHCRHGHPFTDENTRLTPDGARRCITCERARSVLRRQENNKGGGRSKSSGQSAATPEKG